MDNQTDKSQDATPYRLDEARKKGQIGKSQEFVSIVSLLVMLSVFLIMLPKMGSSLLSNLQYWLINANQFAKSDSLLVHQTIFFLKEIGLTAGIMLVSGAISVVLFSLVHAGPVFSLEPLKLDLTKLNPVTGLKRIFSKKGLFEIFKMALKIFFIAAAMVFLWGQIKNLVLYQNSSYIFNIIGNWKVALTSVVICFLLILFAFSLFDLWYSKKDFAEKMRMSTRDIKDEYKKREGDPEIKHKRKKNMRQLMQSSNGISNVKNADVIITNPTHYAIALQYRASKMPLPKVLSKGRGVLAKLIIFRAKQNNIPIIRQPKLARSIYKNSVIDSYIPVNEQPMVAEIYRKIINRPGNKVFL